MDILSSLPNDSSPLLRQLVELASPTQSIESLSISIGCTLAYIMKLVAHLIFWRKATVIDVVRPRNTFRVAKCADLTSLPALEDELASRMGTVHISSVLANLKAPITFGAAFKTTDFKGVYLELLETLLRARIIEVSFFLL
jgi:hypothetical protein